MREENTEEEEDSPLLFWFHRAVVCDARYTKSVDLNTQLGCLKSVATVQSSWMRGRWWITSMLKILFQKQ